jgi:hypothetical protein
MNVHKLLRWMMKWKFQCLLLVRNVQLRRIVSKKMRGPFDSGEVRELKGTSPVENRLFGRIGDVSGTEGMELDMPDDDADQITTMSNTETPTRAETAAWALRLHDPSPVSTVMSITPRAGGRARESTSPTPTPFLTGDHDDTIAHDTGDVHNEEDDAQYDYDYNDYADSWPNDQGWGDDAMMEWDATSARDDDVSSVDREEAGLSDDDWGRDALLAWDDDDDDDNDNDNDNNNDDETDDFEIMHQLDDETDDATDDEDTEETENDLHARGMPTYRDWAIKDLQVITQIQHATMADMQKLCTGFGYRPISKHDALVDLAIQCWRAMHPPPAGNEVRCRSMAPTRSSSISSADMPLSKIRNSKSTSKVVQTGRQKRIAPTGFEVESGPIAPVAEGLNDRFLGMIRGDSALWLRILRYEVSSHKLHVDSADIFFSRSASMNLSVKVLHRASTRRVGGSS